MEILDEDPWKWTKKGKSQRKDVVCLCFDFVLMITGCVLSEGSLEQVMQYIESNMMATYIEPETGLCDRLSDFIDFAFGQYGSEIDKQIESYGETKIKMKSHFVGTMWDAFVKREKDSDEQFALTQLKRTLLNRIPLIFALFILKSGKVYSQ